MDNASPSPPKRPRTIDFLTSQLVKPVRYFPFTKKSGGGSVILQEKLNRVDHGSTKRSQNTMNSCLTTTPFPSTMKFVPNKEANISNKMQKLKLKSPDGRDLGEINVQLLPQKGDGIGGKTIMLQKHSLFSNLDSTSAVSILKPIERNNQTSINGQVSLLQTKRNLLSNGNNCVSINSVRSVSTVRDTGNFKPILNVKQKFENQMTTIVKQPETIPKYSSSSLGSKVVFVNIDKQTGLNTVKSVNNDARSGTQLPSNQKIIVVHAENYPDSTEGKKNNSTSRSIELRIPPTSKDDCGGEATSSTSNVRTIPSVFWNPTKFPEISAKASFQKSKTSDNFGVDNKEMTMLTRSPDFDLVETAGKSINLSTSSSIKKQKPRLNSWTIVKTSSKKLEGGRKSSYGDEFDDKLLSGSSIGISKSSHGKTIIVSNLSSETPQNVTSTTNNVLHSVDGKHKDNMLAITDVENYRNKSNNDKNKREDIMVIVHGDMNTLQNNSREKDKSSETASMEVDAVRVNLAHEKNPEIFHKDSSNSANSTSPSRQQDLDIIQKALSSCADQDLREKALKALAECGIGVKRDVPIPPTMSVNDSQTQTTVFSLFEPETLVEYNDLWPTLNKLSVINRDNKTPQHSMEYVPSFSDLELLNDNSLNPSLDLPLLPEFTAAFDEFLEENSQQKVNELRGIFSKPDPIVSKALEQIQKDFQAAKTVDADGMMGIHRAVLSSSIKEVQRQLIVLKAVKQDIEVPTNDGKTSLELAVLHDVDPRIINILLSAGAKPALPLKVHESALIIASKTTSVVLSELIDHVTPPDLLNMVDSEGFAPIHYCAQRGNTHGVKLLIKAGANVNLKDSKSGRTALFHALESRHIDIAWHLLDNGASPHIMNFAGQSAATLVDEHRHNSLAEKFNQEIR